MAYQSYDAGWTATISGTMTAETQLGDPYWALTGTAEVALQAAGASITGYTNCSGTVCEVSGSSSLSVPVEGSIRGDSLTVEFDASVSGVSVDQEFWGARLFTWWQLDAPPVMPGS